jgi:hypothetical protein
VVNRSRVAGYARAVLAALMIVVGLLLFTIAMASVIGQPS